MNIRMILKITGKIILLEAVLLLLPLSVACIYGEWRQLFAFFASSVLAAVLGVSLLVFSKPKRSEIYVKEGFLIVSLAWTILSLIGALPSFLTGDIPSYVDALFETVSGFTTTGASILVDVEAVSRSVLFWRSLTLWIGGMGVLVLMMAILPTESGRFMHIMRAEMPGPIVGKLLPKIRDTAKILYLIYLIMTLVETILLCLGGMNFFDSLLHSFSTAATGGFGTKVDSFAGYSPYCQWVVTIFMILFGVNFNLYYLLLIRRFKSVLQSRELKVYFGIIALAVVAVCVNIFKMYSGFFEALRHSAFQVASIITTTGYASTDFNLWPGFSKTLLVLLMFIGGCAGSTAGGLKVSRVMLMVKMVKNNLRRMLHPRAISRVRHEGEIVEDATLNEVSAYFSLYMIILAVVFLIISLEPFDFTTNLTATISCLNNVGPGLGAVGPAYSYVAYSDFAKIVLSFAMLIGRLEIYPVLFMFSFSTWVKR